MAHTCCNVKAYSDECFVPSDEECHELREEDNHSNQALELYMSIYARLRKEHFGAFSDFWCNWWTTINNILPAKFYDPHSFGSSDYVPNIDEIRLSVQSKSGKYDIEDCEDVFLDSVSTFE